MSTSQSAGNAVGSSPLKGSAKDEKNVTEASAQGASVVGELPRFPTDPSGRLPPRRLSTSGFSMRIPNDADAREHVKETHGHDSWEHKVLEFLHHRTIQTILACLLFLDVCIIFTELALWAVYPVCEIIKRDGVNCCPAEQEQTGATNRRNFLMRLLSGGGDSHEHICENPELETFTAYRVGCDDHKWHAVHTAEHVLFGFTMAILSIFMLELLVLMAAVRPWVFFRHLFYAVDFFVVAGSIVLEAIFHSLKYDLAQTFAGFLIVIRLWRFVRIGHGIVEIVSEVSSEKYQELLAYTEALEDMIKNNNMKLPEGWNRPGLDGGEGDVLDEIEKSGREKHRRAHLKPIDESGESGNSGKSTT